MEERYIRNLGALTEQECAQLRTKTVFVAGCGGLGGYLIEMLLRLGVGAIRAADGDVFEASNLNRQLLSSTRNLGRSKAEAAQDRTAVRYAFYLFKLMSDKYYCLSAIPEIFYYFQK